MESRLLLLDLITLAAAGTIIAYAVRLIIWKAVDTERRRARTAHRNRRKEA